MNDSGSEPSLVRSIDLADFRSHLRAVSASEEGMRKVNSLDTFNSDQEIEEINQQKWRKCKNPLLMEKAKIMFSKNG